MSAEAECEEVNGEHRAYAFPVDLRREHGTDDGVGEHHPGVRQKQKADERAKLRRPEARHEPFGRAVTRNDVVLPLLAFAHGSTALCGGSRFGPAAHRTVAPACIVGTRGSGMMPYGASRLVCSGPLQ